MRRHRLLDRRLAGARVALPPTARGAARAGHRDHPRRPQPPPSRDACGTAARSSCCSIDAAATASSARCPSTTLVAASWRAGISSSSGTGGSRSINGPLHLSQCAEWRRGIRRAARAAGLDAEREHRRVHDRSDHRLRAGRVGGRQLPRRFPIGRPAVVCVNDRSRSRSCGRWPTAASACPATSAWSGTTTSTSRRCSRRRSRRSAQPKYELGRAAARAPDRTRPSTRSTATGTSASSPS